MRPVFVPICITVLDENRPYLRQGKIPGTALGGDIEIENHSSVRLRKHRGEEIPLAVERKLVVGL